MAAQGWMLRVMVRQMGQRWRVSVHIFAGACVCIVRLRCCVSVFGGLKGDVFGCVVFLLLWVGLVDG